MKLGELLSGNRITAPLEAGDLGAALRTVCGPLVEEGVLSEAAVEGIVDTARRSESGELIRVTEAILLAAARCEALDELTLVAGVSPTPFRVDQKEGGDATLARAVILLVTPRRLSTLRVQAIPTLVRFLRSPETARELLESRSPDEVRQIGGLEELEVHDRLLVEDALTPLQYRIYPDTPLEEAVDLMVRRELHAVPVVGESHEVLGIITEGDALAYLLPRRLGGERMSEGRTRAREVMSRSVLCVSEDQSLVEAANMMINKEVEQLPVVREGELIGFLTRETVLRHLFGR